jgi:hypothetical protein
MSGCGRTCILWLLGWAAAAAAFYGYLRRFGVSEPALYLASVGAGLCVAIAASYVLGVIRAARERAALLAAMTGDAPRDGEWAAVAGHIRASSPLRAPLSGESVVAYEYKISKMMGSGKSRSERIFYHGKALTPSTISSRQGTIRLLAVPMMDLRRTEIDAAVAVANAARYIDATTFETTLTPKEEKTTLDHEWTDDDGSFRVDKQPNDLEVDLASCDMEEKSVRQGEMVCAFGLYSQQRGGLIPHPNWAKHVRIMRGDAADGARQLRNRMIKFAIGIAIFAAAAYGITRLYEIEARNTMASGGAAIHTRSSRTC